ncbi:DUF2142 domain-containing protein [Azospirillum canadense]|uniref:DUF2142 domain-containing protein n=1 Tax=Azospirillum canadense TaxID=403962 RepID=UPI002225E9E7|nr:DUF2142 domain-containing protein [Azospirillum canadense]MCW2240825.1 hypothetical protein [Azospirillum canadense]
MSSRKLIGRGFVERVSMTPAGAAFRPEPLLIAILAAAYFALFGGLLLARTPPFAAQDEAFHWQRVLQIADGHLLAETLGPNSWGGPIDRAGYLQMLYHIDRIQKHGPVDPVEAHALSDHLAAQPPAVEVVPFPSSASFAPLAYLPQAAGVAAARAAGLGPLGQMRAGRVGNLAVYGLMVAAILRALPGGRVAVLALALSPVALQSACSLSADPLNLTLPVLMLALVWRLRDRGTPLGRGEGAGLVALSAALGLLKLTMAPFAGAALYLPAAVAGSSLRSRFALGGLCLAVALGIAVLWNAAYPFVPGPYWGTGADPAAQIARLRTDPLEALRVFADTVRDWAVMWWRDGYGRYGGHPPPWHGYASDRWVLPAFWVLLALALCDGPRRRDAGFAAGCLVPAPAYALLVLAAFWVGFTPVGSATVDGVQGRYFLPMHALVLLGLAAAAGAWRPAGLRRGLRLALFAAALALGGAVLVEVLGVWKGLWPVYG